LDAEGFHSQADLLAPFPPRWPLGKSVTSNAHHVIYVDAWSAEAQL